MSEITLKGLTKRFEDGARAVDGVDLAIGSGESSWCSLRTVRLRQDDAAADDRRP